MKSGYMLSTILKYLYFIILVVVEACPKFIFISLLRKAITLCENSGIYVQNTHSGEVSYVSIHREEPWNDVVIYRGGSGEADDRSVSPVSSIYIWNKNFSHSAYEKSEAKMAAIDVQ